ncbi:MAG: hypothetical protein ACJ75H_24155 [Thermoanaerobaculia bacterium]
MTAFKEEAEKRKQNLSSFLAAAESIVYEAGGVKITYQLGDTYSKNRLVANLAVLEAAAVAVWGDGTRVEVAESRNTPSVVASEKRPEGSQEAEKAPAVQALLEIFPGSRIEAIQEHGSYTED